ncbi:MAG: glycosyltransferase family 4 protein, partial [Acidimicrobiales bacterium]
RAADVVICVSATTANRLAELTDVRAVLVVAEHGVDHERFGPGRVEQSALPEGILRAPESELIVHVGTLEPRKGIVDLVKAFDEVALDHPKAVLVLAGLPGWGTSEVSDAIAASSSRNRIQVLGFVPDDTVIALMRAARVVAYPSLEEGFGLPALEAMAVGAPLVTSERTAMAEFAGEAGWLAPSGQPRALARVIRAVLGASQEEVSRRREEGFARARMFTWRRTGELPSGGRGRMAPDSRAHEVVQQQTDRVSQCLPM